MCAKISEIPVEMPGRASPPTRERPPLAERLRYQRELYGLSQGEVGRLIGSSAGTVSRAEQGLVVSDRSYRKICSWLENSAEATAVGRLKLLAEDLAKLPAGLDRMAAVRLAEILRAARAGHNETVREWASGLFAEWQAAGEPTVGTAVGDLASPAGRWTRWAERRYRVVRKWVDGQLAKREVRRAARRLAAERLRRGLNQRDAADQIGISQCTLSRCERGEILKDENRRAIEAWLRQPAGQGR